MKQTELLDGFKLCILDKGMILVYKISVKFIKKYKAYLSDKDIQTFKDLIKYLNYINKNANVIKPVKLF